MVLYLMNNCKNIICLVTYNDTNISASTFNVSWAMNMSKNEKCYCAQACYFLTNIKHSPCQLPSV